MADTPQKTPPPEEMHWGIAYLREDIQDLRASIVRLDAKFETKIDQRYQELDTKIDARTQELDAKIDARAQELDAKIDARAQELDAKIDARAQELHARIDKVEAKVDDLQRVIREQGTMLTQRMVMLTGLMTTVLLAAMKL